MQARWDVAEAELEESLALWDELDQLGESTMLPARAAAWR
jgi:hypothetical protein